VAGIEIVSDFVSYDHGGKTVNGVAAECGVNVIKASVCAGAAA
jgi:hypothetical protein